MLINQGGSARAIAGFVMRLLGSRANQELYAWREIRRVGDIRGLLVHEDRKGSQDDADRMDSAASRGRTASPACKASPVLRDRAAKLGLPASRARSGRKGRPVPKDRVASKARRGRCRRIGRLRTQAV